MKLSGCALVIGISGQANSFSTAFSFSPSCSLSVRSCIPSGSFKYSRSSSSWDLHLSNNKEEEFDPLRSPHSYPNGIDSKNSKEEGEDEEFDPLRSPHSYPNGINAKKGSESSRTSSKPVRPTDVNAQPSKVGVLLIDHGSRRPSSNDHLLNVASLYQSRAPENVVVRAAHMEIAPPFIKDGIEALWKEDGCDKVVCHPYFLSPGRHVTEDVPELIYGAVIELNGGSVEEGEEGKVVWDSKEERLFLENEGKEDGDNVEVIMTDVVGSNIDRMVDIVGDMVADAIGVETLDVVESLVGEKKELGGFFGNIQQMMDEQL